MKELLEGWTGQLPAHHFPHEGPYHGSQEEFDDECMMLHDAY